MRFHISYLNLLGSQLGAAACFRKLTVQNKHFFHSVVGNLLHVVVIRKKTKVIQISIGLFALLYRTFQ